jgi:Methyltransferase domain
LKLSSRAKDLINGTLNKFNLELSTRTALTLEHERVGKLISDGYFDRAAFPLLKVFSSFDAGPILHGYTEHREDCRRLLAAGEDPRRYKPINNFFPPADACPTYLVARIFQPKTWFEIGSGNSTRVVRQAITDGKLSTNLICIDPHPRVDISSIADEVIRSEVQTMPVHSIVDRLNRNDVLFIDSSHELKAGGDVTYLLLNVIPKLRPGVIVHIMMYFCRTTILDVGCKNTRPWMSNMSSRRCCSSEIVSTWSGQATTFRKLGPKSPRSLIS